MKKLLLSVILSVTSMLSLAQMASNAAEAQAQIAEKCTNGCIVLSTEDTEALMTKIQMIAAQQFIAGVEQGEANSCKKKNSI